MERVVRVVRVVQVVWVVRVVRVVWVVRVVRVVRVVNPLCGPRMHRSRSCCAGVCRRHARRTSARAVRRPSAESANRQKRRVLVVVV